MEQKKSNNRGYRFSGWVVTINTQKRIEHTDERYAPFAARLKQAMRHIAEHPEDFLTIKRGQYDDATFKPPEIWFTPELAPETQCVHGHMVFSFMHKALIHIDCDKIKEHIKQSMDIAEQVYVNQQLIKNKGELARAVGYLTKYAGKEPNLD